MNKDLISIVVPIYKVEKYLKKSIDSIINQTYKNLEIILVDDGSPDNCGKICDEYKEKDSRIKVIHKKNGGLSDARNAGIDIAIGEYIAFVDPDDYIAENYVQELYNLCIENNTLLSECNFEKFNSEDKIEIEQNKTKNIYTGREMAERLYSKDLIRTIVVWNKLYKMEIFKNLRFPKGKINEDEFVNYKIFYNLDKVAITNEKLYYYRYAPDSIMNRKFNEKRLDLIDALEERIKFYKERKEKELYKLTLKCYIEHLDEYYRLCRRDIADKKYYKLILKKYRHNFFRLLMLKNINLKRKIRYILFFFNPNISYSRWIKNNEV